MSVIGCYNCGRWFDTDDDSGAYDEVRNVWLCEPCAEEIDGYESYCDQKAKE